jgi:hypothetical protein
MAMTLGALEAYFLYHHTFFEARELKKVRLRENNFCVEHW